MTQQFSSQSPHSSEKQILGDLRRRRLIQINIITSLGLAIALFLARNITIAIFAVGLASTLTALIFALKHRAGESSLILLVSMSAMLFALALTGAGIFDIAILGYPGILVFAAILSGIKLFTSVLICVLVLCTALASLVLTQVVEPHTPTLSWEHMVFVQVILVVIGFSVYVLASDIKKLVLFLQSENKKVQESQAKIEHLAHHDSLTDLPNRYQVEKLFQSLLEECKNEKKQLAVFFIDLDNFKPVNDALGHAAGDTLLIQLTNRLREILPESHQLARFGGDEFLVLAPIEKVQNELIDIAEKIIVQSSSIFDIVETQVNVSASVGVAVAPSDGTDFNELSRKADLAMYRAKKDGKNTFYVYKSQLEESSENKFKLLQLIRPALQANSFDLYYQPIVCLQSKQIVAYEALLRWPQPDGTFIRPDAFIPVAESSGLINEIGNWVLNEACSFCVRMREKTGKDIKIAVNLSAVQFNNGRLPENVAEALSLSGLPAVALELEITESLLVDNEPQLQSQLTQLRELGVSFSIDDFGTGYSNLGYLRDFQANKLKIDRSFVSSIMANPGDEMLVRTIVTMASNLGLRTVAEGIENAATLGLLKEIGCEFGQGFHWAEPQPESLILS